MTIGMNPYTGKPRKRKSCWRCDVLQKEAKELEKKFIECGEERDMLSQACVDLRIEERFVRNKWDEWEQAAREAVQLAHRERERAKTAEAALAECQEKLAAEEARGQNARDYLETWMTEEEFNLSQTVTTIKTVLEKLGDEHGALDTLLEERSIMALNAVISRYSDSDYAMIMSKAVYDTWEQAKEVIDTALEEARTEGYRTGYSDGILKGAVEGRAQERERCCRAVCRWCADDKPLRLVDTKWVHSVDPFLEGWSWEHVRTCEAQTIREVYDDTD